MGNVFHQGDQAVNRAEDHLASGIQASSRMMEEVLRSHPQDVVGRAAEDGIKDGALYLSNLWHNTEDSFSKGVKAVETGAEKGVKAVDNGLASGGRAIESGVQSVENGVVNGVNAVAGAIGSRVSSDMKDISAHPGDAMFLANPASAVVPIEDQGKVLRGAIHGTINIAQDGIKGAEAAGKTVGNAVDAVGNYIKQNMHDNSEDIAKHPGDAIFAAALGPAETFAPVAPEGTMLRSAVRGTSSAVNDVIQGAEGFGEDAKSGALVLGGDIYNGYNGITGTIRNGYDSAVRGAEQVTGALEIGFDSLFNGIEHGIQNGEDAVEHGYDNTTKSIDNGLGEANNAVDAGAKDVDTAAHDAWLDITNPDWW